MEHRQVGRDGNVRWDDAWYRATWSSCGKTEQVGHHSDKEATSESKSVGSLLADCSALPE